MPGLCPERPSAAAALGSHHDGGRAALLCLSDPAAHEGLGPSRAMGNGWMSDGEPWGTGAKWQWDDLFGR